MCDLKHICAFVSHPLDDMIVRTGAEVAKSAVKGSLEFMIFRDNLYLKKTFGHFINR